jgi:hypothetical protein
VKSPSTWFLILAALCIIGPYMLGVAPRRRRHWTYIAITIALLALLLPLMAPLRST